MIITTSRIPLDEIEGSLEDLIRTSCYGDVSLDKEDMEGAEFEKVRMSSIFSIYSPICNYFFISCYIVLFMSATRFTKCILKGITPTLLLCILTSHYLFIHTYLIKSFQYYTFIFSILLMLYISS